MRPACWSRASVTCAKRGANLLLDIGNTWPWLMKQFRSGSRSKTQATCSPPSGCEPPVSGASCVWRRAACARSVYELAARGGSGAWLSSSNLPKSPRSSGAARSPGPRRRRSWGRWTGALGRREGPVAGRALDVVLPLRPVPARGRPREARSAGRPHAVAEPHAPDPGRTDARGVELPGHARLAQLRPPAREPQDLGLDVAKHSAGRERPRRRPQAGLATGSERSRPPVEAVPADPRGARSTALPQRRPRVPPGSPTTARCCAPPIRAV